jgi:hypothetical protein
MTALPAQHTTFRDHSIYPSKALTSPWLSNNVGFLEGAVWLELTLTQRYRLDQKVLTTSHNYAKYLLVVLLLGDYCGNRTASGVGVVDGHGSKKIYEE